MVAPRRDVLTDVRGVPFKDPSQFPCNVQWPAAFDCAAADGSYVTYTAHIRCPACGREIVREIAAGACELVMSCDCECQVHFTIDLPSWWPK